jgi:hypothetical protein
MRSDLAGSRQQQPMEGAVAVAVTKSTPSNPANAFLRMAGFNFLVAIMFFVAYLFYRDNTGERSVLVLIASLIGLLAAILSIVAYNVFRRKLENLSKR